MAITINSYIEEEGAYGEDTKYGISATAPTTISYLWEYSEDTGATWNNLYNYQYTNAAIVVYDTFILVSSVYTELFPNTIFRVTLSASGESGVQHVFGRSTPPDLRITFGNGNYTDNVFNFTVGAIATYQGDMALLPKFRWQKSFNDGISWDFISSGSFEEGSYVINDNSITVTVNPFSNTSMKIRAAVSVIGTVSIFSKNFDVYYNYSELNPVINIIFSGTSTDSFGYTVYSIIGNSSDGSRIFYQWQYTTALLENWENIADVPDQIIGSTTPNLALSQQYVSNNTDNLYRCVLSTASISPIISDVFTSFQTLQINIVYSGGLNNSDPSKSIGGPPSSNFVILRDGTQSGVLNNLFSDVSRQDAESGVVDYRCFYITNDSSSDTLYQASVFIQNEFNSQSSVQLGISKETDVQILSFSSIPSGGTFKIKIGPLTTSPIDWNSNPSILQSNIQNALGQFEEIDTVVSNIILNNYQISFIRNSNFRNFELIEIVDNNLSPYTEIQVEKQKEGQPINSIAPRIFNSQSPPFNVVFYETNSSSKLLLGDLSPGDVVPIWIRRYTIGSVSSDQLNGFNLRIIGSKNKTTIVPQTTIQSIPEEKPDFYYE
jgi:hypothetical protein